MERIKAVGLRSAHAIRVTSLRWWVENNVTTEIRLTNGDCDKYPLFFSCTVVILIGDVNQIKESNLSNKKQKKCHSNRRVCLSLN